MSFFKFLSFDMVADYISNTMNITYTDNPTAWAEALKEIVKDSKPAHQVRGSQETIGWVDTTENPVFNAIGDDYIPAADPTLPQEPTYNTSTGVGGGGAKSAPTAKTIITENGGSGGGTAVITDEAIGVKDNGISTRTPVANVIGGLLGVYGLVQTGITIANMQVWKDLSNYVFDTEFTEDTPLSRVIDFFETKAVNLIHDVSTDGNVITHVPDSIAEKLYNFLSNHMIEQQTPGISIDNGVFNNINTYYNFINRTLPCAASSETNERYMSATNPDTLFTYPLIDISDDLFKVIVTDFVAQIISFGFEIATSVATALIASMEGVYQYMREQSQDAVDDAPFLVMRCEVDRGSAPPPKTTPLSLSEIEIRIQLIKENSIKIIEDGDQKLVRCDFNTMLADPPLEPGYSYQAGDKVKYIKRGKSGEHPTDYAYLTRTAEINEGYNSCYKYFADITYPANVQNINYAYTVDSQIQHLPMYINGYNIYDYHVDGIDNAGVYSQSIYSNIGYKGYGESYEPDEYLVTAGIKRKVNQGTPEDNPSTTATKEERYPDMAEKKQNASPTVTVDPVTGQYIYNNTINNYVAASVPFGSENADRIINHGTDVTADPEAYVDDRPQSDKLKGNVNDNDPITGFNEDIENSVKEYNDTNVVPGSYPDPLPSNYPNPQYPTGPSPTPSGDSGDTPTPSTMPGMTASGMCSVYNPSKEQLKNFSAWLWSLDPLENLKKILSDPVDAIIGLHIMYATPVVSTASNIICGYLDSGVAAPVVTQQFIDVDCGHVDVPEYYGNATDYEPYVHINAYLPFVGIVALKPNDVIGKRLKITYGVDVLTGTCLARLVTQKGSSEIQCYTFPGNCSTQVPLTGGNYAQCIRSIASMAVGVAGSVLTANPLPLIGGVLGGAMGASLDTSRSGSLGANAGALGVRKPYLIITRRAAYDATGYSDFYGYPANRTLILGTCRGYTRVKAVHIESMGIATDNEKMEIETLLKDGVIIQ